MCHLVKFYISDTAWFSSIALITFDLTSLFGTAITDSLSLYLLHLNVKFGDVSLNVKFWDVLSRLKCGWWLWLNLVLCCAEITRFADQTESTVSFFEVSHKLWDIGFSWRLKGCWWLWLIWSSLFVPAKITCWREAQSRLYIRYSPQGFTL